MTPQNSPSSKRPLGFSRWLQLRGMNPSRRRPLGRQAVLWIEYRSYLERIVGAEQAKAWFEKQTASKQQAQEAGSRNP